jgi:hypothetical protein
VDNIAPLAHSAGREEIKAAPAVVTENSLSKAMKQPYLLTAVIVSAYRRIRNNRRCIPEVPPGLIVDYDDDKSEFMLGEQAQGDGFHGLPGADEVEMNEAQLQMRDKAVQRIGELYAFLAHELGAAARSMSDAEPLNLRNKELEAETALRCALLHDAQLKRASEKLAAAEQGLGYFVTRHDLQRPPAYTESLWLVAMTLAMPFIVGLIVASYVFIYIDGADANSSIVFAAIACLVNIGLGTIGGGVGWRLAEHRFVAPMLLGWIVTLSSTAAMLIWNFCIAHYSALVQSQLPSLDQPLLASAELTHTSASIATLAWTAVPQDLFSRAWQHAQQTGWTHISLWAWLLLATGIAVFLMACMHAWTELDRYWDYREFDMRRRLAERNVEEEYLHLVNSAESRLDACLRECKATQLEIERQAAMDCEIADAAEQRTAEVSSYASQWIIESNRLLKHYRTRNTEGRRNLPVPGYWKHFPTPQEYRELLTSNPQRDAGHLELASEHLQVIRRKREAASQLVNDTSAAYGKFERFIVDLKASIPAKVRELRNAARKQSDTVVAARIHHESEIATVA